MIVNIMKSLTAPEVGSHRKKANPWANRKILFFSLIHSPVFLLLSAKRPVPENLPSPHPWGALGQAAEVHDHPVMGLPPAELSTPHSDPLPRQQPERGTSIHIRHCDECTHHRLNALRALYRMSCFTHTKIPRGHCYSHCTKTGHEAQRAPIPAQLVSGR